MKIFLVLFLIFVLSITSSSELIENLTLKGNSFDKFYRHSDLKVVYNNEANNFQCIVKNSNLIYNLPSFIIPNNRLLCDFSVKSTIYSKEYVSQDTISKISEILSNYYLDEENISQEEINLDKKHLKFGKAYNEMYKMSLKNLELTTYLLILQRNGSSDKQLTQEIKDFLNILALFDQASLLEINRNIFSYDTQEIIYLQSNLNRLSSIYQLENILNMRESVFKAIKDISNFLKITLQDLTNYFIFISSHSIKLPYEKLLTDKQQIELNILDMTTQCINESMIFCRFSNYYNENKSKRLFVDKYTISEDNYRLIFMTNNDILHINEEYFIYSQYDYNADYQLKYLVENFLLRGITESYNLKASCHEKIKEDKELSKLNLFLNSLCSLIN